MHRVCRKETAQWTISFPRGNYTVRAELVSGAAANVDLQVVQDPLGRGDVIHQSNFDHVLMIFYLDQLIKKTGWAFFS